MSCNSTTGFVFRVYLPYSSPEAPGADFDVFGILDCVQYTLAVKRCQDDGLCRKVVVFVIVRYFSPFWMWYDGEKPRMEVRPRI